MNISVYPIFFSQQLSTIQNKENAKANTVNFRAFPSEVLKPMKNVYEAGTMSLDELFSKLPPGYQDRIISIANSFKGYGVDRNKIFQKVLKQPSMITSTAELIVDRVKAHAFVERHKSGSSKEELIPFVIENKNLGKSVDSIFAALLLSKAFKSTGRPDCFVDESGIINTFKRYYRKNPDVKFDKIEILNDDEADAFINFTKKLSVEMSGKDNLFDISVKKDVIPSNMPKPLSEEKAANIKDILSHLKYNYFENFDNAEFLKLYKTLPDRYHKNFSDLLLLLRSNKEKLSFYDLMPLFLRNNFFFNMKAPEALNLIRVKLFIDKNNGKSDTKIKDIIESGFFSAIHQTNLYSHFLASKMFPEKTKMPWYMKKGANADLTDDIKTFLKENPTVRYEFDIENEERADSFYNYAKGLSRSSIGTNVFRITIKE